MRKKADLKEKNQRLSARSVYFRVLSSLVCTTMRLHSNSHRRSRCHGQRLFYPSPYVMA